MVENYVIAGMVLAIFAVREITFLYREKTWGTHRDNLIKIFRNRETDLLNRLMADNAQDFLILNGQDAQIEQTRARATDEPTKVVEDLLEQTGMGHDGFSTDGVSVI
jgi:hypothetical protein